MKKKTVKIPIYFDELVIIKVKKWDKVNKKYKTKATEDHAANAFVHRKKNGVIQYIMCFTCGYKGSIIAHETTHTVNNIFGDRGVLLDTVNDEAQAYFTGWVFQQVEDFYNELNKK